MTTKIKKRGFVNRALDVVERVGNKLPDPFIMFAILTAVVIALSAIFSLTGVSVLHPQDPTNRVEVFNLLSSKGLLRIFSTIVSNFTGFAPLGTVLVVMVGLGVMEQSGLLAVSLRKLVLAVPRQAITATIVFAAVMSNLATDAGYVVLVPLGAAIFASMGRHPIAGLAAAFAGVSGGFSANLIITSLDPLLGGISEQAARVIDPNFTFNVTGNWYFLVASTFLIVAIGTIITEKFVEPRLGKYSGATENIEKITEVENRGLRLAGLSLLITTILLSLLIVLPNAPLRNMDNFVSSPFFTHLVPVLLIWFLVPGLVYGMATKKITKPSDVTKMITVTIVDMSGFIALAFMAGQFVGFFTQSNLGLVMAVSGAEFLQALGLTGFGLVLLFMIICAFVNLFIGSASAKWAIMAPIFVPIMMRLGYTPEFTQLAYRIADSSTNVISPLMTYFAMIIAFAQKYDKNMRLGTLMSVMLPYSAAIFIFWSMLLFVWMLFNLPIGPGTGIFM